MTPAGYALGVDLGTSHTVAVLRWPDGRTRPLLHDGAPLLPSGVYLDESGRLHVGHDAQRLARLDPARFEPNPKRRIDEAAVWLGDRAVPVADLLAALLAAVARTAVETVGFLPPTVLTYPAAWGRHRRDVLAAAAARAGWPPPLRLVPEPVAAARYFTGALRRPVPVGSSLAVFDFGGGTLDVAVVRNEGAGFAVLGSGGLEELGGLDIDASIVDHLGAPPVSGRDRRAFWDDVRGAKEMLSRATVAPVAVPGVERAVHLTRDELESVATPLLRRAVAETAAVIGRCGLRPDQLAGLFLVGGSSRLPLAARMLHAELGIAPTTLEQPELPVAEGALAELPADPVPAPAAPVSPPVPPAPPVAPPRSRYRRALVAGAAAAVVVALAVAGTLYLTRGGASPVRFGQLEAVGSQPVEAGSGYVSEQFTAVVGDRGYTAYVRDKQLHLAALDMGNAKPAWPERTVGSADDWKRIVATPDVVVGFAQTYAKTDRPLLAFAVDPASGKGRGRLDLYSDDRVHFYDNTIVVVSDQDKALRGYDTATLRQRWKRDLASRVTVVDVGTAAAVDRPDTVDGGAAAWDHGAEHRLLVIGADKKLQVYDATSGKPGRSGSGIGDSLDTYLGHEGRLYVADNEEPYRITAYDLDTFAKPQIVYTATDPHRRPRRLAPCGSGRVCVLDNVSSDADTTEVAAIDTNDGGQQWRHAAPQADTLRPVGDGVLATGDRSGSLLFDRAGRKVLKPDDERGAAVRVNGASLLVFSGSPSSSLADVGLVGVRADDGGRTPLGTLTKAYATTCSWNEAAILCAAEKKFTIWRFAN